MTEVLAFNRGHGRNVTSTESSDRSRLQAEEDCAGEQEAIKSHDWDALSSQALLFVIPRVYISPPELYYNE